MKTQFELHKDGAVTTSMKKKNCEHTMGITIHGECGGCDKQFSICAIGHKKDKSCCPSKQNKQEKSFFDYTKEQQKEIILNAGIESAKEMRKMIKKYEATKPTPIPLRHISLGVASPLGDEPSWIKEFDNRFGHLIPKYDDIIKDFIHSILSQSLHEERNALRRWMKGKQVTKEKVRAWFNEREEL